MSAIAGIESLTALTGGPTGVASLGSLPDSDTLALPGATGIGPVAGTGVERPEAAAGTQAPSFASVLDRVAAVEENANAKGVALATGQLQNVHEFTAAAASARLAVQLTTAVRNRALDSFSEVMRMQL